MKRNVTYKWSAMGLALIFSLYIVGLPIIISACPMIANGGRMACCAETPMKGMSLKAERNTSCCTVVIAAKPTTTEFVSSTLQLVHISHLEVTPLIPLYSGITLSQSQSGILFTNLYPVTEQNVKDICILTSSLLI